MRHLPLPLALAAGLAIAGAAVLAPGSRAEEEPAPPAKLEKHPFSDAQPGEWIRFKVAGGGQEGGMIQRVLGVREKEGKKSVFVEVWDQNLETKVEGARVVAEWLEVPEFKATESQTYLKDEMVELELNGKKCAARHLKIQEQVNPPMPYPVRTREVWYTNDALGSGKVKEYQDDPPRVVDALEWGTLTAEQLAERRKLYPEELKEEVPPPADKPADKPAGEGKPASCSGSSCGAPGK